MGPVVILFIAITAIISSTYLKSKKMSLERERMRLMGGEPLEESKRKGLFGRKKEQITNFVSQNTNNGNNEMEEIKQRMENLETILLDGLESNMITREKELQQEIRSLSSRLKNLEK